MSWITSSSSGVSSVCPSFSFLFLVCLKCDDPWLSGHINKRRASLILTSTWHGCPAWVGLESLCGWMGMRGAGFPGGLWAGAGESTRPPFLWWWGWCCKVLWCELSSRPFLMSVIEVGALPFVGPSAPRRCLWGKSWTLWRVVIRV